jgi:hypothetical protein
MASKWTCLVTLAAFWQKCIIFKLLFDSIAGSIQVD